MLNQNKNMFFFNRDNYFFGSTKHNINSVIKFKKTLNFEKYYYCEQTHSNIISIINENSFYYPIADGLITFKKLNFPIIIRTADCVPLFFYSKYSNVYGIIHAGRVGTQKEISVNLIKILLKNNIDINKIQFVFGPHICKECYQIDKNNDIHFDLYKENIYQLTKNGINIEQISNFNKCTLEENNLFSYRENKTENRILNFIFKDQNPRHP